MNTLGRVLLPFSPSSPYDAPGIYDVFYITRYGANSFIPLDLHLAISSNLDLNFIPQNFDVVVFIGNGNISHKLSQPMSDCWLEFVSINAESG